MWRFNHILLMEKRLKKTFTGLCAVEKLLLLAILFLIYSTFTFISVSDWL